MKRSVNFNGTTRQGRAKATKRAFSAVNLIATMRNLGMSDEEIKTELLKMRKAKADPAMRRIGVRG